MKKTSRVEYGWIDRPLFGCLLICHMFVSMFFSSMSHLVYTPSVLLKKTQPYEKHKNLPWTTRLLRLMSCLGEHKPWQLKLHLEDDQRWYWLTHKSLRNNVEMNMELSVGKGNNLDGRNAIHSFRDHECWRCLSLLAPSDTCIWDWILGSQQLVPFRAWEITACAQISKTEETWTKSSLSNRSS